MVDETSSSAVHSHVSRIAAGRSRTRRGRGTILNITTATRVRWPTPTAVHRAPYCMRHTYDPTSIWILDAIMHTCSSALVAFRALGNLSS